MREKETPECEEKDIEKEVSELAKKIALFGLGVAAITQEKIEEFVQELVTKGELNREEGKQFVREVVQDTNRQVKDVVDSINKKVKECAEKVETRDYATKKDIERLATRGDIEDIKERIDALTALEELKQKIADLEKRIDN